jgi:hypothetical protein
MKVSKTPDSPPDGVYVLTSDEMKFVDNIKVIKQIGMLDSTNQYS